MRYLFGDSSESDLEFNYLAFLREVVECAVVMLEAEQTLTANVDRRRVREQETANQIRAVEELGKDAFTLVQPIVKEQPKAPVGLCAASIAMAIRDAVEKESNAARAGLNAAREEVDREDGLVRARARTVLEKLLKSNDLPGAEKELEASWASGAAKVTMRQKTGFGLEAVVSLESAGNPLFGPDMRVERIDPNVEVHSHEAGGWLKKGDKLVAHKLGRYQVVSLSANADVVLKLRATPDSANAAGFTITFKKSGEITVEGTGSNAGKDFTIEERDRAGLRQVADKLGGGLRALDQRTGIVSAELDGKPLAEHPHPRVLAERLIAAVAPTVQKIIKHGRSPGELVLRRQLANDRREEIFIPVEELVKKIQVLPTPVQATFAPLSLVADGPRPRTPTEKPAAPVVTPAAVVTPPVVTPPVVADPVKSAVVPAPPPRDKPKTVPPPIVASQSQPVVIPPIVPPSAPVVTPSPPPPADPDKSAAKDDSAAPK